MPENPIMCSTGYLAAEQSPQSFVLTEQGIFHVTEKAQNLIITASSVFTKNSVEQFESFPFTLDVNDYGVADLALTSIDIGFTDILSMASTAMNNEEFELDTEVAIYKGTGNNQFATKASASKDFDIAIKLNESNS